MTAAADKPEDSTPKSEEDSAPVGGKGDDDPKRKLSHTARRAQERREKKLAEVQEQIADGSLTIRQMTPEEREKYPPKPRKPRKGR